MRDNSCITIPGSKSQSIRALLVASFARGKSKIINPLISQDTISTANALRKLNVKIDYVEKENAIYVDSSRLAEGCEEIVLDMGNSGTGTYLLLGLAASLGIEVKFIGDESLMSRPIGPLAKAYRDLGAYVEDNEGYLPLTIKGPLEGGKVSIECKSSQYLSSLLLAAVFSSGDTEINCPLLYEKPYVSITLSWLDSQNIDYTISHDYLNSYVKGGQHFAAGTFHVSGDFSSASFFFVLALIHGKTLKLLGLDKNDPQGDKRVLDVLKEMGAEYAYTQDGVTIKGPEVIKGGSCDINDIPDALPILAVASLFAESEVKLYNVAQARIKETDRIKAMREELEKVGAHIYELDDGLIIKPKAKLHGAKVSGRKDHRIIMALSILATKVDGIEIDDTKYADVTFPNFFSLLGELND